MEGVGAWWYPDGRHARTARKASGDQGKSIAYLHPPAHPLAHTLDTLIHPPGSNIGGYDFITPH